jgi:TPR repeat protein
MGERTYSLAVIALVALLAGIAMYFMNAAHERQVADLQKQLEAAKQQAAGAEKARKQAEEARIAREKARAAEEEARRAGELAVQRARAEERERREEEARRTADAARERWMAEKAAAEKKPQVTAARAEISLNEARALEAAGSGAEAVKLYARAARNGNGKAAVRLGEIYDKGIPGVAPDYAESLKWYNLGRVLGEDVPMLRNR